MLQHHITEITVPTQGQGLIDITQRIAGEVSASGFSDGQITLLCRHTSASLMLNENAAPAVQRDMLDWLDSMAPESPHYAHDDEGPDDMPAHLKAALTGASITIPFAHGAMMLGTWQGIFLAEHRRAPHQRQIAIAIIGTHA